MLAKLIEVALLPPLNGLLLATSGLALLRTRRRLGAGLLIGGLAFLWLQSTPLVASALIRSLQREPSLELPGGAAGAQAIVVLSADLDRVAPEHGGETVGALALQRLRYAAHLQRETDLPLLASGGLSDEWTAPHAELMKTALEGSFGVPVRWVETRSRNTMENAAFTRELLAQDGVQNVVLVTHAWHMPRARRAFEAEGLEVIPAPTGFRSPPRSIIGALSPRWTALRDSSQALHEYIGFIWYEVLRL